MAAKNTSFALTSSGVVEADKEINGEVSKIFNLDIPHKIPKNDNPDLPIYTVKLDHDKSRILGAYTDINVAILLSDKNIGYSVYDEEDNIIYECKNKFPRRILLSGQSIHLMNEMVYPLPLSKKGTRTNCKVYIKSISKKNGRYPICKSKGNLNNPIMIDGWIDEEVLLHYDF